MVTSDSGSRMDLTMLLVGVPPPGVGSPGRLLTPVE